MGKKCNPTVTSRPSQAVDGGCATPDSQQLISGQLSECDCWTSAQTHLLWTFLLHTPCSSLPLPTDRVTGWHLLACSSTTGHQRVLYLLHSGHLCPRAGRHLIYSRQEVKCLLHKSSTVTGVVLCREVKIMSLWDTCRDLWWHSEINQKSPCHFWKSTARWLEMIRQKEHEDFYLPQVFYLQLWLEHMRPAFIAMVFPENT